MSALLFVSALVLGLAAGPARAQDLPAPLPTPRPDTLALPVVADSLILPDTVIAPTPPVSQRTSSGLTNPVQFSAMDSLIIIFNEDAGDRGRLVGNVNVSYDDVRLRAPQVDILFDQNELRARGIPGDTSQANMPQFEQAGEAFTGVAFAYNLESGRGRVVGAQTQMEDGFIRAEVAKVDEDSTLYILHGSYTTCDCGPFETPSYSLRARRMKVVDQKWIYTGPIQLYIFNIPTPVWLPFGFLPAQEGRRSGPLPPEYGEDQRGFYLRNWGYYWAINDYTDLQVRAGIWTKGSWQLNPSFRYNRRDYYSGGLNVDYVRERSGEQQDPDFTIINRSSLRWTHNQTINPTSRLTANVNLSSTGYLRTVSEQYNDNVRQSISSSINYSKQWRQSGRSLSMNLRQNQILATGNTDLTLPELSFNQSSRTPFKNENRLAGDDERWYEKITVSYRGRLTNQYSFQPLPDETLLARGDTAAAEISWYEALFDATKYERATGEEVPFDLTASHSIPVSASFNINRLPVIDKTFRLNLTPSIDYDEDWFIETERQVQDTSGTVIREQEAGFFALRQFSTNLSANTTFYGIFPVGIGPYQGVRHTVRPTVTFSYQPDFSGDFWGYSRALTDLDGNVVLNAIGEPVRYNLVRQVRSGQQQALSFSLSNVFETKRVQTDSTGEQQSRTLKMFDLNLSSSYNLAADSLKLSSIQVSGRTRILGKLSVNFSSTFSPYRFSGDSTRTVNDYVFNLRTFDIARLTRLSLSTNFSLNSRGGDVQSQNAFQRSAIPTPGTSSLGLTDPFGERRLYDQGDGFADFSIPWSVNVRASYSLNRPLARTTRAFTVNTDFDFNLTPRWKIRGQTGFDFERMELVTTSLNLFRDFECWEMSFNWVPFGQFQSWGFDLHVKSGKLRDFLRIRQPRSERDRGFGQLIQ